MASPAVLHVASAERDAKRHIGAARYLPEWPCGPRVPDGDVAEMLAPRWTLVPLRQIMPAAPMFVHCPALRGRFQPNVHRHAAGGLADVWGEHDAVAHRLGVLPFATALPVMSSCRSGVLLHAPSGEGRPENHSSIGTPGSDSDENRFHASRCRGSPAHPAPSKSAFSTEFGQAQHRFSSASMPWGADFRATCWATSLPSSGRSPRPPRSTCGGRPKELTSHIVPEEARQMRKSLADSDFGRGIRRFRTNVGRWWPSPSRCWANSSYLRSSPVQVWSINWVDFDFVPILVYFGPNSAEFGRRFVASGPNAGSNSAPHRSELA